MRPGGATPSRDGSGNVIFFCFTSPRNPDGRWLAYQRTTSGESEVSVRAFPGPGEQWQVSSGGGRYAAWRSDGKELNYVSDEGMLMAVAVGVGSSGKLELGAPQPLFAVWADPGITRRRYDVARDGQRFLVVQPIFKESTRRVELIQNWPELLER